MCCTSLPALAVLLLSIKILRFRFELLSNFRLKSASSTSLTVFGGYEETIPDNYPNGIQNSTLLTSVRSVSISSWWRDENAPIVGIVRGIWLDSAISRKTVSNPHQKSPTTRDSLYQALDRLHECRVHLVGSGTRLPLASHSPLVWHFEVMGRVEPLSGSAKI